MAASPLDAPRLGAKVRALRRREGLTQRALAAQLGISASYLNLIEHDKRPLTTGLLIALAQRFALDLAAFSADHADQLRKDLLEVFAEPEFDEFGLSNRDIEAFVDTAPQVARAVRALFDTHREVREAHAQLAGGMGDGAGLRLPSEEVSDLIQEAGNHFPDLEAGAEGLWRRAKLRFEDLAGGLLRHLEQDLMVDVRIARHAELPHAVRRYDPDRRELVLRETLAPRSRIFELAHQIALLSYGDRLDDIVRRASFAGDDSRRLARVALANYFAGAVMMPYAPLLEAAQKCRYDLELLGHRFRTSLEQTAHRLTSLRRPGAEGIPLHMVRVDLAGNLSKKFSASGMRVPRFGAACSLWNVFGAFLTPGRFCTQLSVMPDGRAFFDVARTAPKGSGGYHAPSSLHAIGLGCDVADARAMVYSDGVDLGNHALATRIGVNCRMCERADCAQRAFPLLHRSLAIDPNIRRLSTYAPG